MTPPRKRVAKSKSAHPVMERVSLCPNVIPLFRVRLLDGRPLRLTVPRPPSKRRMPVDPSASGYSAFRCNTYTHALL